MADYTKYVPIAFELIGLGMSVWRRIEARDKTPEELDAFIAGEIERVKAKVASAEDRWRAAPGPDDAPGEG